VPVLIVPVFIVNVVDPDCDDEPLSVRFDGDIRSEIHGRSK